MNGPSAGRSKRTVGAAAIALSAAAMGAAVRSSLPPFVLDDPFWRAFWSGPPVAGLFAVCAATIAFYPAYRSTRIARENAAREQWWKRAEWALGQAGSDSQTDREVGNDALVALLNDATETEGKMIYRTIENFQGARVVDTPVEATENDT
jgi:hypothetical protein